MSLESLLETIRADFIRAGIMPGKVIELSWSGRMSRARGNCRKKDGGFAIHISRRIESNEDVVRETLAHELLHTVDGCFGHNERFRQYAKKLDEYGYHIQTHYEAEPFELEGLMVFECSKCGIKTTRQRSSQFTRHPEKYVHKGCGGHFKRVR